jgi:hypothetical protein
MSRKIRLQWQKFTKLTDARSRFPKTPCVYVQTDPQGCPIRIGKASEGLEARYRGGTGYAIDAAMHGSGNLVFVAAVEKELCGPVEVDIALLTTTLVKSCRRFAGYTSRILGHRQHGLTSTVRS